MESRPGIEGKTFYILIEDNQFSIKEELRSSNGAYVKVLETPHKKWWKVLLQYITFGIYKAPYQYKVELLETKDERLKRLAKEGKLRRYRINEELYIIGIGPYRKEDEY